MLLVHRCTGTCSRRCTGCCIRHSCASIEEGAAPDDWIRLGEFFNALKSALHPLRRLSGEQPLPSGSIAHVQALELLRRRHESDATIAAGDDESALRLLFESLQWRCQRRETWYLTVMPPVCEPPRETKVRGHRHSHPRIKILGLLEARLIKADLMVSKLGSTNRYGRLLRAAMPFSIVPCVPRSVSPCRSGASGRRRNDFVEAMGD